MLFGRGYREPRSLVALQSDLPLALIGAAHSEERFEEAASCVYFGCVKVDVPKSHSILLSSEVV
jgi:hypothetical protein